MVFDIIDHIHVIDNWLKGDIFAGAGFIALRRFTLLDSRGQDLAADGLPFADVDFPGLALAAGSDQSQNRFAQQNAHTINYRDNEIQYECSVHSYCSSQPIIYDLLFTPYFIRPVCSKCCLPMI